MYFMIHTFKLFVIAEKDKTPDVCLPFSPLLSFCYLNKFLKLIS